MSDYDNSNRFSLWLNDKREKATHPHMNGQGEAGAAYWANAWFADDLSDDDKRALQDILKRHAQVSKRPFISISIKAKESQTSNTARIPAGGGFDDIESDLPF